MALTLASLATTIQNAAKGSLKDLGAALRSLRDGDNPYIGGVAITASAAEINAMADIEAGAITATSDGLTTGLIAAGVKVVIITSSAATNAVTLPGIASNSLPIGYTIRGRVTANGCEVLTPASTNETINGVDSDGTNQLDLAATTGFIAWVESATGWCVAPTASIVAPDND